MPISVFQVTPVPQQTPLVAGQRYTLQNGSEILRIYVADSETAPQPTDPAHFIRPGNYLEAIRDTTDRPVWAWTVNGTAPLLYSEKIT